MPKVVYLTGAPAAGKSSTAKLLAGNVSSVALWEYGERLTEYLKIRSRGVMHQEELRTKSSLVVTPEDVAAVDIELLEFVEENRGNKDVIIDSHAVTKELYGYRVTPFSLQNFSALKPDEIWVLHASPETTIARIAADSGGRPSISEEEARTHTLLQSSVAITYGMSLGIPIYFIDSSKPREEILGVMVARLGEGNPGSAPKVRARNSPRKPVDLRAAINAISDVVQNRPRPLRVFDQIHMKAGDMVMQSEIVADWSDGKRLIFIGDGDAISVCVAYLQSRGVFDFGPRGITVLDFDERTVNAVNRFADKERIPHLDAILYNVLDALNLDREFDCFYTNPPWGASNEGESVNVFVERGIEAVRYVGEGMVVIADDDELEWPKRVLARVQAFSSQKGFYVSRMQRKLHEYHLDDAPELKSCNLYLGALPGNGNNISQSAAITNQRRLRNFYGKTKMPRVRYVRERKRLDYGVAHDDEYDLELIEGVDE
jgi:predicted methyltransferase/adenylate kinase